MSSQCRDTPFKVFFTVLIQHLADDTLTIDSTYNSTF